MTACKLCDRVVSIIETSTILHCKIKRPKLTGNQTKTSALMLHTCLLPSGKEELLSLCDVLYESIYYYTAQC